MNLTNHSKQEEPKKGWRPTPEYNSWTNMKQRCLNPKHPNYSYYGGRGITIFQEWINSFAAFYEYMGDKPTPSHTIDRINNSGNYEPGNVRWATMQEQSLNRRRQENISGLKGVTKQKHGYQVAIVIEGVDTYIGSSPDIYVASKIYKGALRAIEATKKLCKSHDEAREREINNKWVEAFKSQCQVTYDGDCKYFKYDDDEGPEDVMGKFFPERMLDNIKKLTTHPNEHGEE